MAFAQMKPSCSHPLGSSNSAANLRLLHQSPARTTIVMRDRSKNRKPLQKGRNLSIEAIQTVQALKRAANTNDESLLRRVFDTKVRRLLKFDMVAVVRELLHQNRCLLALQVFEDLQKEHWYKPQLLLYAEMVSVLASNGFFQKVESLIAQLKLEKHLEPDVEGFNALLDCLMNRNLTGLATEVFHVMKSVGCDPDKSSFKILIHGFDSNSETSLSYLVRQEAQKYYGESLSFLDDGDEEE